MSRFETGLQPYDDKNGYVGIYMGTDPNDTGAQVARVPVAEVLTETCVEEDEAGVAHAMADARFFCAAPKMFAVLEAFAESFSSNGEFNSRTAEHSIAELLAMAKSALADAEACECESPGTFNCGVPGIVGAPNDPEHSERCDLCERFPSDEAAREHLKSLKGGS